jgi:hypothetical protein
MPKQIAIGISRDGSSRRRKEADRTSMELHPPPYVGGYKRFPSGEFGYYLDV